MRALTVALYAGLEDLHDRMICRSRERHKGTHQAYDSVDAVYTKSSASKSLALAWESPYLKCSARVYVCVKSANCHRVYVPSDRSALREV